jgi:hypothetical protein
MASDLVFDQIQIFFNSDLISCIPGRIEVGTTWSEHINVKTHSTGWVDVDTDFR